MSRSLWVGVLAAFAWLLGAGAARAETPAPLKVALRWQVPGRCLDPQALRARVEQQLERSVFVDETDADVSLTITARDPAGRLELTLGHGERPLGVRTLDAEKSDCPRFLETLSLVVSMLIDTSAEQMAEQAPAPTPQAPTRSIAAEPVERPPVPQPPPARPEALPVRACLSGQLGSGLMPGWTVGVRAEAVLESRGGWRWLTALEGWPRAELSEPDGAVRFRAVGMALGVGYRVQLASERWRAVPQLEIGATAVHAEARGFQVAYSAWRWVGSVAVGARLESDLTRALFVTADAALRLAPARAELKYREADGQLSRAFRPDFIGSRAGAGLGLRF